MKNTSLDSGFLASNITSRSILAARIEQMKHEEVETPKAIVQSSRHASRVRIDYNVDASTWK